jgi:tol-pal system protein YbgF
VDQLGEPLKLYRAAYADLLAGRHDAAERGFREFVRRYPSHDYADNAQYWLGESFYDRKRFSEAAAEFRTVLERFPRGNKAPDAMLKLGYCELELGQGDGRSTLEQLERTFPQTEAARLAERRLGELAAGHAIKAGKRAP